MKNSLIVVEPTTPPTVDISEDSRIYKLAGLFVVFGLFGGALAWASLAHLNGAIIAHGKLTVESKRKTVQHLDGGVISEILINDGDFVEPEQLLIRLDKTVDQVAVNATISRIHELQIRSARLIAERDGAKAMKLPSDVPVRSGDIDLTSIFVREEELFRARQSSRIGASNLLNQQILGLERQIDGLKGQIVSKDRQAELIQREFDNLNELYKKGYTTVSRLMTLERQIEELKGESNADHTQIASVQNDIIETELELGQQEHDFVETVTTELRTIDAEIVQLQNEQAIAEARLKRTEIVAPIAGVVLNLAVHTIGGVVSPGQDLLDLVPKSDKLIVEARIAPHDIDKVSLGQSSRIRMSAFNQATTPEVSGKVQSVSADQLIDAATGEPYFLARIEIDDTDASGARDLALVPGMPAEVFIETGKRTAISYFTKPFTDRLARTFTEG